MDMSAIGWVMIAYSSNCLINQEWLASIAEGDSIINATLLLLYFTYVVVFSPAVHPPLPHDPCEVRELPRPRLNPCLPPRRPGDKGSGPEHSGSITSQDDQEQSKSPMMWGEKLSEANDWTVSLLQGQETGQWAKQAPSIREEAMQASFFPLTWHRGGRCGELLGSPKTSPAVWVCRLSGWFCLFFDLKCGHSYNGLAGFEFQWHCRRSHAS